MPTQNKIHHFAFHIYHFFVNRSNLLRPLRGREPEGMWNLLSIVRELFRRGDVNAISLLVILTEECLANDQVLVWWFDSRSQASGNSSSHNLGNRGNTNAASTEATKHACAGFCDELVSLWRLAALNPKLTDDEREEIKIQLQEWHEKAVEKGRTGEKKPYSHGTSNNQRLGSAFDDLNFRFSLLCQVGDDVIRPCKICGGCQICVPRSIHSCMQSTLSHTILTPIHIRSAFFLCQMQ